MKKLFISLSFLFLSACGGGSSDSGGSQVTNTDPGSDIPENFLGVYNGTIDVTASGLGLTVSEAFELTITVNENGTIDFTSEGETASAGITNAGDFSVSVSVDEDGCTGTIDVSGSVDGTIASGSGSGSGECDLDGNNIEVTLEGEFSATR